jgi:hypothetical protein
MNPFSFIERAADSMAQYPTLAFGIALVGGILSTST